MILNLGKKLLYIHSAGDYCSLYEIVRTYALRGLVVIACYELLGSADGSSSLLGMIEIKLLSERRLQVLQQLPDSRELRGNSRCIFEAKDLKGVERNSKGFIVVGSIGMGSLNLRSEALSKYTVPDNA